MEISFARIQPPGIPTLINEWNADDDFGIHPKGSQPKQTLVCPKEEKQQYLIPGHRYIFKTTKKEWQNNQVWSEIIAYRIGQLIGLEIPPSFLAVNESSGKTGVLMEFFFGFPNEREPSRFIHASEYMARLLADKKRGRPHGIRENIRICRALGLSGVINWWGQVLAFDALIGNSDRHPDNWGFLISHSPQEPPKIRFAPIFDNGTSLGYEHHEKDLQTRGAKDEIEKYIHRGRHHCGWSIKEDGPTPHMALCEKFLKVYPAARDAMLNVLRFDRTKIEKVCFECTQFDVNIPFTHARAKLVSSLIMARQQQLRACLGG